MTNLFRSANAKSTYKKYGSTFREYSQWALHNGVARGGYLLKPTEAELMLFAERLSRRMGGAAVGTAMSGLSACFLEAGIANVTTTENGKIRPMLKKVLTGIKRKLKSKRAVERRALTVDKLRRCSPHIRQAVRSDYDAVCYTAILSTGVYGMLRVGEMTSPKIHEHDPETKLNVEGVTFGPLGAGGVPEYAGVLIKMSKTGQEAEGITIRLFANGGRACAVYWLWRWCGIRKPSGPKAPLFVLQDGSYVTRGRLQRVIKSAVQGAGYDATHFNTHSMRKGGATSLSCANWPKETIQMLGRWSSDCYLKYLQMNDARRKEVALSLAKVTTELLSAEQARGKVDANGFLVGG